MQFINAQQIWYGCMPKSAAAIYNIHTRCMQERHHRVIRRFVKDRHNTTSLEQGLAEDLVGHSLHDLRAQPRRDGFDDAHNASASTVRTLQESFGCSGEDVRTCINVRASACILHHSDIALYSFDGRTYYAGEILCFASAREWEESAFITVWNLTAMKAGFWEFDVTQDVVRVPICNLRAATIAHVGASRATMICPPFLNYL